MLGKIVRKSFEFHVDSGASARAHDACYTLTHEDSNLPVILGNVSKEGYVAETFRQNHSDGSNGHIRFTRNGMQGFARLTSEGSEENVVYRFYVPTQNE